MLNDEMTSWLGPVELDSEDHEQAFINVWNLVEDYDSDDSQAMLTYAVQCILGDPASEIREELAEAVDKEISDLI